MVPPDPHGPGLQGPSLLHSLFPSRVPGPCGPGLFLVTFLPAPKPPPVSLMPQKAKSKPRSSRPRPQSTFQLLSPSLFFNPFALAKPPHLLFQMRPEWQAPFLCSGCHLYVEWQALHPYNKLEASFRSYSKHHHLEKGAPSLSQENPSLCDPQSISFSSPVAVKLERQLELPAVASPQLEPQVFPHSWAALG